MQLTDRLSPHFRAYELAKHDGGERELPTDPAVCANLITLVSTGLEPLRRCWEAYLQQNGKGGDPSIKVVCGWRSPEQNSRIKGAQNSQHMFGRAADICCDVDYLALREGLGTQRDADRMEQFAVFVEKFVERGDVFGGIGIYRHGATETGQCYWVHVDTRPRIGGHIVRWFGGIHGVGSELA